MASPVKAFGSGTPPGDSYWTSSYEGLIMAIGVAFFIATFIFMEQMVATHSHKREYW